MIQLIVNVIEREPALVVGLVNSLIALVVAFGLNVTPKQVGAINAFVAALLAFVTRSQVSPVNAAKAAPQEKP